MLDALRRGTALKVISGAAVNAAEDVARYVTLWCAAGADAIDVCADYHVVRAAVAGRAEAARRFGPAAGEVMIMASPTLPGDVHRLKAVLTPSLCTNCNVCLPPVCPDDCIYPGEKVVTIDTAKCRGCDACVEICPPLALRLEPMATPPLPEGVRVAVEAGADAVELHLSGESPEAVRRHLREVWPALAPDTLVSVCVGSQQSSPAEVIAVTRAVHEARGQRPIVIQVDGSTMGGRPGGIQALALAELVLDQRLPDLYVIASGGVTELTWETAARHQINVAGLGIGIRSRELAREAIEDPAVFASDEAMLRVAAAAHILHRPAELLTVETGRAFRGPALARIGAAQRKHQGKKQPRSET
jgi:Pyruvate/2-oxoacid:ferredoxin oxidoreductase delta subunit